MPTTDTKRQMMNVGVFILPLLLVQAASVIVGAGSPRAIEAAAPGVDEPAAVEPSLQTARWSDAQLAAADYVRELRARSFGAVPLLYESVETVVDPGDETAQPGLPPPPQVTLQAILASANSVTVLIDGKTHRISDEIRDSGWVIDTIDADSRSITIRDPQTDRVETVTAGGPR